MKIPVKAPAQLTGSGWLGRSTHNSVHFFFGSPKNKFLFDSGPNERHERLAGGCDIGKRATACHLTPRIHLFRRCSSRGSVFIFFRPVHFFVASRKEIEHNCVWSTSGGPSQPPPVRCEDFAGSWDFAGLTVVGGHCKARPALYRICY